MIEGRRLEALRLVHFPKQKLGFTMDAMKTRENQPCQHPSDALRALSLAMSFLFRQLFGDSFKS